VLAFLHAGLSGGCRGLPAHHGHYPERGRRLLRFQHPRQAYESWRPILRKTCRRQTLDDLVTLAGRCGIRTDSTATQPRASPSGNLPCPTANAITFKWAFDAWVSASSPSHSSGSRLVPRRHVTRIPRELASFQSNSEDPERRRSNVENWALHLLRPIPGGNGTLPTWQYCSTAEMTATR